MEIKIEVPEYDANKGIIYKWENGFSIGVQIENNEVTITANKAGLMSLANHLLNLAQDKAEPGSHLHFDEYNSLEEGSLPLMIQKAKPDYGI